MLRLATLVSKIYSIYLTKHKMHKKRSSRKMSQFKWPYAKYGRITLKRNTYTFLIKQQPTMYVKLLLKGN